MPTAETTAQAVREQLARVLASPGFARNERLSRFLRFVVEGHLQGKPGELKESIIAIEVFGRKPHIRKDDSIVRTEASRLRARLAEYYSGQGRGDPLVIELPKGGYTPRFHQLEIGEGPVLRAGRRWPKAVLAAALAIVAAGAVW